VYDRSVTAENSASIPKAVRIQEPSVYSLAATDPFEDGLGALYLLARDHTGGSFAPQSFASGGWIVLLDLGKVVSFAMSILSLCALLDTGFFIPAARWETAWSLRWRGLVLPGVFP
jgi:hypothetical protein